MSVASGWLAERGLAASDLTVLRVEQLMAERRAAGRSRLRSTRAMRPLLSYLRGLGVAPPAMAAAPSTPVEVLIERYSVYLLERRGLAPSSVRNYVGVARVFLADRERVRGELALTELDGAAVSEFVLRESRRSSVGSAKCTVTRLRALLRFLYVESEIGQELAGAVPSVASWRLASLVKALDARSVARLRSSCDRRTRVGRRDFAILTMLWRLGLRAGEVGASSSSTVMRTRVLDHACAEEVPPHVIYWAILEDEFDCLLDVLVTGPPTRTCSPSSRRASCARRSQHSRRRSKAASTRSTR